MISLHCDFHSLSLKDEEEWRNDGGMMVLLEVSKKFKIWKTSHFDLIQSFGHHSIMVQFLSFTASSQSARPPLQRGSGGLNCRFLFESHPWPIHIIPGSFHHSWIIPLIISVKSIRPPPSAEGVGWIELSLPLESHPSPIHIIPGSFHHSGIIPLIISVKSIRPTPSAEGGGWIDLTLKRKLASDRPPCFEG